MKNAELIFHQHMIQDYLDCKRRFQLRYLQQLDWPAELTSDQIAFEQHIRQGNEFHRLVQQIVLNIPEETLLAGISNPDIRDWWQVFVSHFPEIAIASKRNQDFKYLAEYSIRGISGGESVFAKFDLLVVDPGNRIWIYDWKTTQSPINPHKYLSRAQTKIYRWVLVNAGSVWNYGKPLPPERISMTYWSPSQPDDPILFQYDTEQYQADSIWLDQIIREIRSLNETQFEKTADDSRCRFCNYRSLCHRGNKAGNSGEMDQTSDLEDLDISSIEAIEY